jgi:tetratricopeptide (TPR) repeat protein
LDYDLGLSYYASGRIQEADAAMQKAAGQNESVSYRDQAKQFLAMRAAVNDPAQAEAAGPLARQILAKDPNNVPALMVTALLSEQKGAPDEAVQTYEKVLSIYPLFAPAMRQMAILYSHSEHDRDLKKAYDLAEKARAAMPDDVELSKTLGRIAYGRGDYDKSISWLREISERFDNDGEVFYYLGMDYYHLKQPIPSKQALNRALELHLPDKLAVEARRVLNELK